METETIVLGGGCFWCTEAVFLMLKGVHSVEPGYARSMNTEATIMAPTYEAVSTGTTPYIEVIKVDYDPHQLSFEELLHVFFTTHDPTTLNRQGNDIGPQYASVIFYTTPRQKEKSEHYIEVLSKGRDEKAPSPEGRPIVTRVEELGMFYKAEDYHKNYYEKNKSAGYCQLVIAPKVEKIEEKFKHLLK